MPDFMILHHFPTMCLCVRNTGTSPWLGWLACCALPWLGLAWACLACPAYLALDRCSNNNNRPPSAAGCCCCCNSSKARQAGQARQAQARPSQGKAQQASQPSQSKIFGPMGPKGPQGAPWGPHGGPRGPWAPLLGGAREGSLHWFAFDSAISQQLSVGIHRIALQRRGAGMCEA